MSQDIVADALNQIMNTKRAGKDVVVVKRYSKILLNILDIAKKEGYVKDFKINDEMRMLTIKIGKVNECKAIKPRFDVKTGEIEKYVRRFLPARDFGIIVLSTSMGLMTHKEVYENKIGGCLVAFFY